MSKLFIFIGRSGCGKGTQAELLKKVLVEREPDKPVLHIETGKLLRDFAAKPGYANDLVRQAMAVGQRLPDFLAVGIWMRALIENFTGKENLIFDGSPRSLLEAQAIDTVCRFFPELTATVIYLNLSPESARRRLAARGRGDDATEAIEKRLRWFDEEVMPAVEHFRASSLYQFLDIDGEPAPEVIHQAIVSQLSF
jgi:adenylate kinase family enzyme